MPRYRLIEAKSGGDSDFLLLRDGEVISRWSELTSDEPHSDLWAWDDQKAAGADLNDYQADFDRGNYRQLNVLASEDS